MLSQCGGQGERKYGGLYYITATEIEQTLARDMYETIYVLRGNWLNRQGRYRCIRIT
jgi:hypothetical protein